jgi:hypothetical protein
MLKHILMQNMTALKMSQWQIRELLLATSAIKDLFQEVHSILRSA